MESLGPGLALLWFAPVPAVPGKTGNPGNGAGTVAGPEPSGPDSNGVLARA